MDDKQLNPQSPFALGLPSTQRASESGAALLTVIIYCGVILGVFASISQVLNNRLQRERITRAQTRMSMLNAKIQNAASSLSAMRETASNQANNPALYNCLIRSQCVANVDNPQPYTLHDSGNNVLSGRRQIKGTVCSEKNKQNCPIQVSTYFEIFCRSGATSCTTPSNIRTTYSIGSTPNAFNGRALNPYPKGQANLALFSCPLDPITGAQQYITGVHVATQQPFCSPAKHSPFAAECPKDSASYGLTADGRLLCTKIGDYCKRDIASVIVLDRSGSMSSNLSGSGPSMPFAQQAATDFVDKTRLDDDSGLVTFGTTASVDSKLVRSRENLKGWIRGVRPSGTTNMSSALAAAQGVLATAPPEKLKVIVFLSDGMVTAGGDPRPLANQLKASGVQIFTIGIGGYTDRNMLRDLASSPSDYFHAPRADQIQGIMEQIQTALCRK